MNTRRYASIESTTCFNFNNLSKKVKVNLLKKFPQVKGKAFDELMYRSLCTFKLNGQEFDYMSSNNHLGGVRWYVKCPKCGRPALKLYLPSELKDREQQYLCKYCHKLKNASLLMGASKRYKKVVKPLKMLEKLRAQLLNKNMTPARAQPILEEYERIERELAASPEYRLWKFQKEHGIIP
jgi:hypothetical protein